MNVRKELSDEAWTPGVHERRISKHLLIQHYLILRRSVQYTEKTGISIAAYCQRGLYKEL